jgi:hypothetical protein
MGTTNDTLNHEVPRPSTLVAIRRGWWKGLAGLIAIWLIVIFGGPLFPPDLRSAWFWFDLVFTIGILALALPYLLGRARLPVFAVREDGIQIHIYQHFRNVSPSIRTWRNLGLFTWDQVRDCRWSPYMPGLLVIQLVDSRAEGQAKYPSARLECRIPEPDRPAVQQAIQSMGKWTD